MPINFDDPALVQKFGSWMRVQVEFYDFLFTKATQLCPEHWKQEASADLWAGFTDGADPYERSVKAIEGSWGSAEDAWAEFVEQVKT